MIDPIILLTEELHSAEEALHQVARLYNKGHAEHGRLLNLLLDKVKRLHKDIFETQPTSVLGAAELIRAAAGKFSFSQARLTARLHDIADSFSEGRRHASDLVWL